MASLHFDVPCLFAKKAKPSTLKDGFYSTDIHSFTKNKTSTVIVSEEFLNENDTVLIIDDFLANGDAHLGYMILRNKLKLKRLVLVLLLKRVSKMVDKD